MGATSNRRTWNTLRSTAISNSSAGSTPHRCRTRQIFGVAKDFCPNSPKLAQKNSKRVTSKEKLSMSFWAPFFSNQSMLGAIFAHIFREFVKVFRDFAWFLGILPGFSPNQHCWGGLALPPLTPVPHQDGTTQVQRCSYSTWASDDVWVAFPWV